MFVLYVTKREDFFYNLESLEVSIKPSMTSMTVLVKTQAKKVFFSGRTTKVQVPPPPRPLYMIYFPMTLVIICTV